MDFKNIIYEKKNGIVKVTLNRPEAMNALNLEIREELAQAVQMVANDSEAKVLVLTGAGRAFCAGGDVKTMVGLTPMGMRDRLTKLHRTLMAILNLQQPVIAMVNGYAVGAGFNLALAADMIIASENAKFCQSFVNVGLIPDFGGLYILPRLVGLARAKELVLTARMIDAAEAERMGLVNKVVPPDELEAATYEIAGKLASGPSRTLGLAKSILNRAFEYDLPTLLELEADTQGLLMQTEDTKEAIQAFVDKRQPKFQGK